jgi:excisionase family DNA binding protein
MPSQHRKIQAHSPKKHGTRKPDILDVHGVAALLAVSTDTVYELLKSGQLPGRKVGRGWKTTRSAVMRWMEESMAAATRERAIKGGDKAALTKLLQSSAVRVKAG